MSISAEDLEAFPMYMPELYLLIGAQLCNLKNKTEERKVGCRTLRCCKCTTASRSIYTIYRKS